MTQPEALSPADKLRIRQVRRNPDKAVPGHTGRVDHQVRHQFGRQGVVQKMDKPGAYRCDMDRNSAVTTGAGAMGR
jgi:hypothetical protein